MFLRSHVCPLPLSIHILQLSIIYTSESIYCLNFLIYQVNLKTLKKNVRFDWVYFTRIIVSVEIGKGHRPRYPQGNPFITVGRYSRKRTIWWILKKENNLWFWIHPQNMTHEVPAPFTRSCRIETKMTANKNTNWVHLLRNITYMKRRRDDMV